MKKVGVWDERLVGGKNMVTNHGAGDSVGGGGSNIALPGEKFIA